MRARALMPIVLVALLAGCGPTVAPAWPYTPVGDVWTRPPAPTATRAPTAEPTAGLPNPASQFCVDQGGTLQLRTAPDGSQAGFCLFSDGTECEEWPYFRGECAPGGVAPTPTAAVTPTAQPGDELAALVQQALPAGAFDGVRAMQLAAPAEWSPLWVVYSYGMRNYGLDPSPSHFLALYTWDGAAWQERARVTLDEAYPPDGSEIPTDYVAADGVTQTRLSSDRVWLRVEGGTGAHSGTFYLFSFDGQAFQAHVAAVSSTPGAGWLVDLNDDGWPEVVLNQTDYYIFCYACTVYDPHFKVLRWDPASQQMVEIVLQPLPTSQPQPLRDLVNAAVTLAQAGLWKDALDQATQALAQLAQYPGADTRVPILDHALIKLHADACKQAIAESPYPLLEHVFYGNYAGAVDVMRAYRPEEIFSASTPLIVGTVAEGWDVGSYIIPRAEAALALQPDLAPAYFLRGWAEYVASPSNVQARLDVEKAADLAPGDALFSQCAAYLRSLP